MPLTVKSPLSVRLTPVALPVKAGAANGANEATTNAVEAALVLLSPAVGVGTVTVPVKVGEAFKA